MISITFSIHPLRNHSLALKLFNYIKKTVRHLPFQNTAADHTTQIRLKLSPGTFNIRQRQRGGWIQLQLIIVQRCYLIVVVRVDSEHFYFRRSSACIWLCMPICALPQPILQILHTMKTPYHQKCNRFMTIFGLVLREKYYFWIFNVVRIFYVVRNRRHNSEIQFSKFLPDYSIDWNVTVKLCITIAHPTSTAYNENTRSPQM